MVEAEQVQTSLVVIDNGSAITKAGFAGQEAPTKTFPTIVGRPKDASAMPDPAKTEYFGVEA